MGAMVKSVTLGLLEAVVRSPEGRVALGPEWVC